MKLSLIEKAEKIATDHYLLKIRCDQVTALPGQFLSIKIGEGTDPLLRRPFSVHNQDSDMLEIVFRVVGKGTISLRDNVGNGDIDVLAPLGRGFGLIENKRALVVGGGVGNAPLYYLIKKLKELNNSITYIYGARSADYIFLKDRYQAFTDDFILTTDDGTAGEKGIVTDFAADLLKKNSYDKIYICGPDVMMRHLVAIAEPVSAEIEVSVENYFGCGIGICYGCTVETTEGLRRACVDGPVFDGRQVK